MNQTETAALLTTIAAYDRRTLGETDVIAWQLILEDVKAADAMSAVLDHYASETSWIMPAHVKTAADRIDRKRRGQERLAAIEAQVAVENPPSPIVERPLTELLSGVVQSVEPVPKPEIDAEGLAAARAELDARRSPIDAPTSAKPVEDT